MAPKLSVSQVLALDELDLVDLIKTHRDAEGDIHLNVSGWGNMSNSQRDQLANRLNAVAEQASAFGRSSLDFDQLNARLVGIATERDGRPSQGDLPQWSHDKRSPTLSPVPDLEEKLETYDYNKLVEDGGRPAYPISFLSQIFEDPAAHHESLRPWLEDPDSGNLEDYRTIFSRQRDHWRKFRRWQLHNRGIPGSGGFAEYFEEHKQLDELQGEIYLLADSSYEEDCRRYWEEHELWDRKWEQVNVREVCGNRGFSEYTVAAARRLADHEFTQRFQFHEEPQQQDEWTTFVEYLEFACWWVDRYYGCSWVNHYSKGLQSSQKRYDAAWQELQMAKVLKGIETEEGLHDTDYQRYREIEQASGAVEAAQTSLASARQPQASRKDLDAAQKRLSDAEELLATITRRNKLVYRFWKDTRSHRDCRKQARIREMQMQWIRGQLSLIGKELSGPKADGGKKRPVEEDAAEEQGRKKQKHDQGGEQGPGRRTFRRTTRSRRAHLDSAAEDKQPFWQEAVNTQTSTATKDTEMAQVQNPRRSARIAAAAEKARKAKGSARVTAAPTPAEEQKQMHFKCKRPLGSMSMRITKRQEGGQQRPTPGRSNGQRR